jgi:hypothetical protein
MNERDIITKERLVGDKHVTISRHVCKKRASDDCDNFRVTKNVKASVCFLTHLEQERNDGIRFRFEPPLLAEVNDEKAWRNNSIDHSCGFVLECLRDLSDIELADKIKTRLLLPNSEYVTKSAIQRGVYDLLCTSSDTLSQVIDSVAKFQNNYPRSNRMFGEGELRWWNSSPMLSGYFRRLTFFRRLTRPICIKVVGGETIVARRFTMSVLNILLDLPEIQEYTLDAVLLQICCLSCIEEVSSKEATFLRHLVRTLSGLKDSGRIIGKDAYRDAMRFVCNIRPQLQDLLPNLTEEVSRDAIESAGIIYKQKTKTWYSYINKIQGNEQGRVKGPYTRSSKSGSTMVLDNRRKFMEERRILIDEHMTKKRLHDNGSPGHKLISGVLPIERLADRALLYTDLDMSLPDFIYRTKFINQVNESFPRLCIPGKSRPRLQQVRLSADSVIALRKLLFDPDGSLSDTIKHDIDTSSKHGFINFENFLCMKKRHDKRWQVPIRKHCRGSRVRTRHAVEQILTGIFNPETEALYDLGILVGGTEDQSLHHDVARQCVSWLPQECLTSCETGMNPVTGWEIDRLTYNEAMSSPIAPSSILICMGDAGEVLLGVQKDQVLRIGSKFCRIKGGVDKECFEIVRENEFLVVLRAKIGAMFTGDFPHAGVRHVKLNSPQEQLLKILNIRIASVLEQYADHDRLAQMKAVVGVLCRFPNLDQLCRLHCSTEITAANLSIPANSIGFSDCLANLPDNRCMEGDMPAEDDAEFPSNVVSPAHSSRGDRFMDEDDEESDDEKEWEDIENGPVPEISSLAHHKNEPSRLYHIDRKCIR